MSKCNRPFEAFKHRLPQEGSCLHGGFSRAIGNRPYGELTAKFRFVYPPAPKRSFRLNILAYFVTVSADATASE